MPTCVIVLPACSTPGQRTKSGAGDLGVSAKALRWSGDEFRPIDAVGRRPEMYVGMRFDYYKDSTR